jgi:hypothetical protein
VKDPPDSKSIEPAANALKELREQHPEDFDVERAAGSLAGKLVTANLVRPH